MAVDLVIDGAALQRLLNSPEGPVARHLSVLGTKVQERARAKVGVDTGETRERIVKRFATDAGRVAVFVGVPSGQRPDGQDAGAVALYHHEGTRPHVIRARNASVLSFMWPRVGRVVFFPSVNHPGTSPNRFLLDALKEVVGR